MQTKEQRLEQLKTELSDRQRDLQMIQGEKERLAQFESQTVQSIIKLQGQVEGFEEALRMEVGKEEEDERIAQ